LIVTWLTDSEGKLKTVAKGARSQKSRFSGSLDLFHRCEIQIVKSRKSDLHTLREVVLIEPCEQIRLDYPRLALASYFVELVDLVTEPEHAVPELFDLLKRALTHLGAHPASQKALLHFESELVRLLGIQHPAVTPAVTIGRAYHRMPPARDDLIRSLP